MQSDTVITVLAILGVAGLTLGVLVDAHLQALRHELHVLADHERQLLDKH